MSDQQYDSTNSGAMFHANGATVFKQGTLNIEGDEDRVMLIEQTAQSGTTYYTIVKEIGQIYPREKKKESDANMDGDILTAHGTYKLWGRNKVSKAGNNYVSLSAAPKKSKDEISRNNADVVYSTPTSPEPDPTPPPVTPAPDGANKDDVIPF